MVSGLVSEKRRCSQNLFQTFAAIETIEVTLDRGLRLSPKSGEFRRFEGLRKTSDSWERAEAVKHRRPSRSAPGLSRKELDGMGCGCHRDRGQGKKTKVARGGWAEDARRPPATSFVSALIAFLGSWGRVGAFDTTYEMPGLGI